MVGQIIGQIIGGGEGSMPTKIINYGPNAIVGDVVINDDDPTQLYRLENSFTCRSFTLISGILDYNGYTITEEGRVGVGGSLALLGVGA